MKKIILTALFAFAISQHLFSQSMALGYESPEFTNLRNGTLYIVPTGNVVFDDSLIAAVAKYWKITPSKALKKEELEQYLSDEKNCFIGLMAATIDNDEYYTDLLFSADPFGKGFHDLYIFHGGKHNAKKIDGPRVVLGSCPFYFFETKYNANCIGFLIKQFNDCTSQIIEKKINGLTKVAGIVTKAWDPAYLELMNLPKDTKILKTKILLVNSLLLKYPLPEKVLAGYKYEYKTVNAEEMISLMNSAPNKYCFLSDENVVRSTTLRIFDVQSKSIIYVGYGKPGALKIKDDQIAALNAAVGK